MISEIIDKITTTYTEEKDRFIFETIRPYCEEVSQTIIEKQDLVEALSKQKPMSPIKETTDIIGRPINHIAYACPRCGVSINSLLETPYCYCRKCGQFIDRSEI